MIIWINGAFGAGKTTCAFELQRRLPDSFVYDPENIGYFLRDNLPEVLQKNDFQDHSAWRSFNYEMLHYLAGEYAGTVIVPMTLVKRAYYDEIVTRLENEGILIQHFILWAEKATLIKRLQRRFEFGSGWAIDRIDVCLDAFENEICEEKIFTDEMGVEDVVEMIAERAGLVLEKDERSWLRKKYDRMMTLVRHIR
jgi:adenylate kinase family enzyme